MRQRLRDGSTRADEPLGALHYRTIPELREYVIVFVETRRVEHRKRLDDGRWLLTFHIGGEVPIEVANISLSFDEIYENLERVDEA